MEQENIENTATANVATGEASKPYDAPNAGVTVTTAHASGEQGVPYDAGELKGGTATDADPSPDGGNDGGSATDGAPPPTPPPDSPPAPSAERRATIEEIINDCSLTTTEKAHLTALFEVYKQMHDLCFVKRTYGECVRRGLLCETCRCGKNLQAVRDAFGLPFENCAYSRDTQKICDEYMSRMERELETNDRHFKHPESNPHEGCPCATRPCGRQLAESEKGAVA